MYDFKFWDKVLKTDSCWVWVGARTTAGYGMIKRKDKNHYCHRYVLELLGHNLTNKVVLHTCDTPHCCNPAHLKIGTHADNVADKVDKDRQPKGSLCNLSKLTEEQVREIKQELKLGNLEQKQIASKYGVDPTTISKIRTGHSWGHINV